MIKKIKVDGMMCAGCSSRVESVLNSLSGVNKAEVNLLTNTASIDFDENKIKLSAMADAVKKAGYTLLIDEGEKKKAFSEDSVKAEEKFIKANEKKARTAKGILWASIVITVVLMYIAMGHMLGLPQIPFIQTNPLAFVITQFVLALCVCVLNARFFKRGIVTVFRGGGANMDTLVSLGSLASMVSGLVTLVQVAKVYSMGHFEHAVHLTHNLYFETAAMILTLVSVGKYFEAKAKGQATKEIDALLKLAPETAFLKLEGGVKEVPLSALKVGDIICVKAGDKVPSDAILIKGSVKTDESMLTGESELVDKKEGDNLVSATIVMKGECEARVEKVGEDTTLSRLIALVEEASSSKAPSSRFADKVSRIFVPVVLSIALITFVIWSIATHDISKALNFAISVLVVSCPCALGLATPCSIMVATTRAAKNGVLIKNSEILERCGHTSDVFFDKTGTLTQGNIGEKNADKPRESAKVAIASLHSMGITTTMLSGDKKEIALRIASEVGIDNAKYELLPEGKLEAIKEKMSEGDKVVMMVGDGINDSPSLKISDVGVAIGVGTDISIESADVVLTKSDLRDVPFLIKLSRKTLKNIKENLFWALIYNTLMIPLAAGVFFPIFGISMNPMIGSFCMGLSSIFVVGNSLRLKKMKIM